MVLNKYLNKKGFVFSFAALLISTLIFLYGSLTLYYDDFKSQTDFNEFRIQSVDNEINYFKNIYLRDVISYLTFNVINELVNYSQTPSNYVNLNQNYSKLNELIFEGLINGSFESNVFSNDKNFNSYFQTFKTNFKKYYKSDIDLKIININIFEKTPYYLTIQVDVRGNISMEDKLSKWIFNESYLLSFPIYNLNDPEFMLQNNLNISIRPIEYYRSNIDWDLDSFNQTLQNNYSVVYSENEHKYTIGGSFLSRLLNLTQSSYKNVETFFSFDYDILENKIYDTSLNVFGKLYANSYLLLNLNNNTLDSSFYKNDFSSNFLCDNQTFGNNTGCEFNGVNNFMTISKDKFNLDSTNKISLSFWINPYSFLDSSFSDSYIFNYGSNVNNKIIVRFNESGNIIFEIGNHVGGTSFSFSSNNPLILNKDYNVVVSFDGDTGIGKIYINGKIDNLIDFDLEQSMQDNISVFLPSDVPIIIGSSVSGNYFEGLLDEFAVYTKVLTGDEISTIYTNKKIKNIDYIDSFHKKGIKFIDNNDYLIFNQSYFNSNVNNFSIEMWIFKDKNINLSNQILFESLNTNNIKIGFNNQEDLYFNSNHVISGMDLLNTNTKIQEGNNYLVFTFDSNNKKVYINKKLISTKITTNDMVNFNNNFTLGSKNSNSFIGIIDEFKLYSKVLSLNEIENNYYNYDSLSKGCCNYLTLINPNSMGFNNVAYLNNVSYSSKLFYDYYNRGIQKNITLFNVTNITSSQTTVNYYNFLVDSCIERAFDIASYSQIYDTIEIINFGEFNASCSNLVRYGIY